MPKEHRLFSERAGKYCLTTLISNKVPLITAFIVGLMTYCYAFTNKLVNHDEAYALFNKGTTIESGRWGLDILSFVLPDLSMPWIYGMITVLLMAISICVIIKLFNIRRPIFQIALSGLIIAFPSLIGTLAYMYTSAPYAISFLLAVVSTMLVARNSLKSFLLGLILMVFSLSIYQAYIAVTASLLVLVLLQRTLQQEKIWKTIKTGIGYVVFLVVSLAVYYALTMLIQRLSGISMGDYAEKNVDFSPFSLVKKVVCAYNIFILFFTQGYTGLMPSVLSRVVHLLIMVVSLGLGVIWIVKTKDICRTLLVLFLMVIFPLSINCMYLFTDEGAIHTLVLYSFTSVYVLVILLIEDSLENRWQLPINKLRFQRMAANVSAAALLFIIMNNIYVGNQAYLQLQLRYENTYSFYTSLMSELRTRPDFDKNTKIAIIGYKSPDFYEENFGNIANVAGVEGIKPSSYSASCFLSYYLGIDVPFATREEIDEIKEMEEYKEMGVYPYYGSVSKIGDVMVVKFS